MPSSTMEEEAQWKLPKDTPLQAQLLSVSVKTINWKDKKTGDDRSKDLWEWEFDIVEGEYAGLKAWGETEDRLTNHPDNKVRQWAETLRGAPFDMGEGLNTDDLLGLPCVVVVDNTTYEKKDGGTSYLTPITDVFPADGFVQSDEPPF
jgi:hypothetical protein